MTEATNSDAPGASAPLRAPLNKSWLIKIIVITLVLLAFGGWGFYDAAVKYPAKGERYASYAEWSYLQALKAAEAEDFGVFTRDASVPDPVTERVALSDKQTLAQLTEAMNDNTSRRQIRATAKYARKHWLDSLALIGHLTPEHTTIADPKGRLDELGQRWNGTDKPSSLRGFDIPMQWLIMFVCWAIAAWLILLVLRTAMKKYAWDAGSKRLTIPGGTAFGPGDLADRLDKRKWDKFIVWADIKKDHDKLGGKRVRFDTYRHAHLEEWLLAMEEDAFGPEEEAEAASSAG